MPENISLNLKCLEKFLSVVLNYAEDTSKAFGLGVKETFAVRLAVEEIFSYLCAILNGHHVEIICQNYGYCIKITFLFKGEINLKAFNLTATVSPDKDVDLQEMGLLIAARQSDSFKITKNKDGSISLTLIKEKDYPQISIEKEKITFDESKNFNVRKPSNEEIKVFISNLNYFYESKFMPEFLKYPGKVVDMVNFGEYEILITIDDNQQITGGILWHWSSEKLIEFFGPYEFEKPVNEQLIIGFLESVGKSDAIGVYSRLSFEKLPLEYFEVIGKLPFYDETDEENIPVYFRQLKEDPGAVIWSNNNLKEFLEKQYQHLYLPRKIETVTNMGETIPEFSVLSVNFYKYQNTAILNLIINGKDIEKNISEHVKLLQGESFRNILFEVDLGISEQAYALNALYNIGFIPKVVLPCGGKGDIVVFKLEKK